MPRAFPLVLVGALFAPRVAGAQVSLLDKVFGKVTDVNSHVLVARLLEPGSLLQDSTGTVTGVGFEVSFGLGTIWHKHPECKRTPAKADTTVSEIEEDQSTHRRVVTYSVTHGERAKVNRACRDRTLSAELALGYTLLTGVRGAPTMRASFEELPALSIYFQYDFDSWWAPYLGLRTGLSQLKGARAYLGDTVLTATGSTYLVAVAPGIVIGPNNGSFGAFAEFALSRRRFNSVDWVSPGPAIPDAFREPLVLSTWSLALGLQVAFRVE